MIEPSPSRFLQKKAELKEKLAARGPAAAVTPAKEEAYDSDLIPDVPLGYEVTDADQEITRLLDDLSVVEAYAKWCGKSRPDTRGKTESIKISCPNPAHPDKNPSAWINSDKETWYCAACDIGGDQYDIAAYHFGIPVPGYKHGGNFRELRIKMAESLGYRVESAPGISYLVQDDIPETPVEEPSKEEPVDSGGNSGDSLPDAGPEENESLGSGKSEHLATVTSLHGDEDTDDEIPLPTLDWRPLVEPETFLAKWMEATQIDDIPEEYYFWNGMLALGLAVGKEIHLYDRIPVFANLFVCILGPTGSGKSQSERHLSNLLGRALPFNHDDWSCKGVDIIKSPASGEALIWSFERELMNPLTGKPHPVGFVRGLISFNELSGLTGRAGRAGNTLKSTLMEMYDCGEKVGTKSRLHGNTNAREPFASLLTTTQTKSINHLLSTADTDAGFVNRILFVTGKPKKRMAIGGAKISIDDCILPIQSIRAWASSTKAEIQWSQDAQKAFDDLFHGFIEKAKKKSDALVRLDLLAKKLVLLFTINEMSPEVELHNVERVKSMMDYIVRCYGVTSEQIGNDQAWEIRTEIVMHVQKNSAKGGLTLRELNRRLARKKYPTNLVRRTIEDLVALNIISAEATKGKRGPATIRYLIAES